MVERFISIDASVIPRAKGREMAKWMSEGEEPIYLQAVGAQAINQLVKVLGRLKEDGVDTFFGARLLMDTRLGLAVKLGVRSGKMGEEDFESKEVFRVAGNSISSDVAGAVSNTLRKHKIAKLEAVGPDAVQQAMRTILRTTSFLQMERRNVVSAVELIDYEDKTVVLFRVANGTKIKD